MTIKDFIMKTHRSVTSSRRKNRRAHFQAPSSVRYRLMSAALSKALKETHKVNAMPVRKDDEVEIVRGQYKGEKGKVNAVYRKRWCLYIEKVQRNKVNGTMAKIPIHPSNVRITKLNMTEDRKKLLARKRAGLGNVGKELSLIHI